MLYRATRSFTGRITMIKGEVREISDPEVENDIVRCGYAVPVETSKKKTAEKSEETSEAVQEVKPKATRAKKGGAKNA